MKEESSISVDFLPKNLRQKNVIGAVAITMALLLLTVIFAILPLPGGDDWSIFYGAVQRVLHGVPLYGEKIEFSYYYNMPWLAVLFVPLGFLPLRWGWSVIAMVSILNVFLLCRRWNMGVVKLAVILLSPPMFYTILHGNIDAFILGAVLLPKEFWVIAALTKPQTAIALSIGALRANWLKTFLITSGVILSSFIIFGNWIPSYLSQPFDSLYANHNLFRDTWPYHIVVGVALAFWGWKQQDEKYLIGASPFFSPYAATSTMIGPLMLLVSRLKDWQAVVLVVAYWVGSVLVAYY